MSKATVKIYAEDSLLDLFTVINIWNRRRLNIVQISLVDLTLMKNHIVDLELELFGVDEEQLCKLEQ